jgi:hypothetical protein
MPLLPYRYRQIAQEARRVQPDLRMHCGIILSNRGVMRGLNTVRQLLALADAAEASPLLDSVWAGDALFVNQRLDAFTLLAAIAGRTRLAVCSGGGGAAWDAETATMGLPPRRTPLPKPVQSPCPGLAHDERRTAVEQPDRYGWHRVRTDPCRASPMAG